MPPVLALDSLQLEDIAEADGLGRVVGRAAERLARDGDGGPLDLPVQAQRIHVEARHHRVHARSSIHKDNSIRLLPMITQFLHRGEHIFHQIYNRLGARQTAISSYATPLPP